MTELHHSPLEDYHRELGAHLGEFGGWLMPVSYSGTVSEHLATRAHVGLFDVSHLGKVLVHGKGAAEFINTCFTNDLSRIHPGKAQYTLCCNPDGGVIDDLIVYYVSDEELFLIPNATNTASIVSILQSHAPSTITIDNQHYSYTILAVQGPQSTQVLTALHLPTDMDYMAYIDTSFQGHPLRICRSGYTGEIGYELISPWDHSLPIFDALVKQITTHHGLLAGLGARDTLRTEMGYPLHGHELSMDISPLQARCDWAIGWDKPRFFGKDALVHEHHHGPSRRLRGLRMINPGVLRSHLEVYDHETRIGITTSGTFSPTLNCGIGLALIDTTMKIPDNYRVQVDVRGRKCDCIVETLPFIAPKTR